MGSSSSHLGSRPPPANRRKKTILSSLLLCGGSTSNAPIEMEDDHGELLVNSAEHSDSVVVKLQGSAKESILTPGTETGFSSHRIETAASSESGLVAIDDSFSEDPSPNVETSNKSKSLSASKELVPPNQMGVDNRSNDSGSSSYYDPPSSSVVPTRAHMEVVNGSPSPSQHEFRDSCWDGVSIENHASEVTSTHNFDSGSASIVSDSSTSDSPRDDNLQEGGLGFLVSERERGQRVLHLDVVSISSNILSSSTTADVTNREARRNSRRLFWDAFSRRGSGRHSDSQTFVFATDGSEDSGPNDRWLLDFSGDFFEDGVEGNTGNGYMGSRTHSVNERRRNSRSEIWERLRGGRSGSDSRTSYCPSGLHPDGTCACQSILMAEESGARASISRIVMLAEALFEVLDEIHRQPVSLSLSMVSLPAPDSVVDSLPVKNHKNSLKTGDDVEQCYICLAEYEEGDKIRVLPCHHEYHMSCVDKWLKEIHGVCPLCRGDVREGFTEASVSNSEISSL